MAEVSFGEWLRRRRGAEGWTQKQFAQQINCSTSALRKFEAEERHPSVQVIERLAEIFNIPLNERTSFLHFARGDWQAFSSRETEDAPWRVSQMATRSNLPASITSFVGRKKERDEIMRLIGKNRLVTLVGAGGIGKTRLALQAAQTLLPEFSHGVWLISFDSLANPALVPHTIGSVLDIREGSKRSITEQLITFLQKKSTLLILDNCEHLIDTCAQLTEILLKNCPNLKIIATSREVMGVEGELIYNTPTLSIPEDQPIKSVHQLTQNESIHLFSERAALALPTFTLTDDKASAITQICRRLDGIPLAIELAAARVDILQVDEILKQLNHCFELLVRHSRTALPRHQTMRASMDWSWGLLTEAEQMFMQELSVFAGGWTLESAQVVCEGNALALTSALVKKSLIIVDQGSERETRYRFHEIVHQYACEKLAESGEEANICTCHLKYFLDLSEQAELGLKGPAQIEWFARLSDERNNIRAALEWADKTDVESGLYLSGRLHRFWESFDIPEGVRWLAKFMEYPQSKIYPLARATALLAQGWLSQWLQQFDLGRSVARECLELYRACGDQRGEVDALSLLAFTSDNAQAIELFNQALLLSQALKDQWRQAHIFGMMGLVDNNKQRRKSSFKEAIDLFWEVGDLQWLGVHLANMADFEMFNGDLESAQKRLNEAAKMSQQLNNKYLIERIYGAYGNLEFIKGNYQKARSNFEESVKMVEDLGFRMDLIWNHARLGYIDLYEGNIPEARKLFVDSAQNFQKDGNVIGVVFALEGMARLFVAVGKFDHAARLIGWADAMREKIPDTRPHIEQMDVDKIIEACLAKMSEVTFSEGYDEGQIMTLDEAVAYALEEG